VKIPPVRQSRRDQTIPLGPFAEHGSQAIFEFVGRFLSLAVKV
jgi:hypothetical protein